MQLYLSFIENEIKKFYNTLSEKAKRLYAAVEALKIGHGGISYIARIVGCNRKTVASAAAHTASPSRKPLGAGLRAWSSW